MSFYRVFFHFQIIRRYDVFRHQFYRLSLGHIKCTRGRFGHQFGLFRSNRAQENRTQVLMLMFRTIKMLRDKTQSGCLRHTRLSEGFDSFLINLFFCFQIFAVNILKKQVWLRLSSRSEFFISSCGCILLNNKQLFFIRVVHTAIFWPFTLKLL